VPISKPIFEPFLWRCVNGLRTQADEQFELLSQFFYKQRVSIIFFYCFDI